MKNTIIKGYIYCYAVNNWKSILSEIIDAVVKVGLHESPNQVNIIVLYKTKAHDSPFLRSLASKGFKIISYSYVDSRLRIVGEVLALEYSYNEACSSSSSHYVWYAHAKGVSQISKKYYSNIVNWRKLCIYFNLIRYYDCVEQLNEGNQACGPFLCREHRYPHFSGNFWWARSSYIKTLLSPLMYLKEYERQNGSSLTRWGAETWILSKAQQFTTSFTLDNIGLPPYLYGLDLTKYLNDLCLEKYRRIDRWIELVCNPAALLERLFPIHKIRFARHFWYSILFHIGYRNLCKLSSRCSSSSTHTDKLILAPENYLTSFCISLKDSRTVYLYGSGKSLILCSQKSGFIRDSDVLHVGFNWSGLLDFAFDLYFFEIYGLKGIHKKSLDIAIHSVENGSQACLKTLYAHNTSDGIQALDLAIRNGVKYMDTFYCPDFRSYSQSLDRYHRKAYLNALFQMNLDANMWIDAFSSPLTIIAMLRRIGYTKFVLHGFDLDDGDYFFRYSTECISPELRHCIPNLEEKPPLSGHDHDSKRCSRLNLPLMLDLINKLGYAKIEYANP